MKRQHIIIELDGGLISAVWSTDKNIRVEVMHAEPPDDARDLDEWSEDTALKMQDIKDKNMVNVYD